MLPRMTRGNWIFWGIIFWIGINFLWIALLESFISQWVGAIIATVVAVYLIKFGPTPDDAPETGDEMDEEE